MAVYQARKDADSYGHHIGILLVDCATPFIPGDVGNATTYAYPVLYRTIPGCTLDRLIVKGDPTLAAAVIETARELEGHGVRGITSDCGFMIRFQDALAGAMRVPVLLSPLIQLPMIAQALGRSRSVGVITADARHLGPDLLAIAGAGPETRVFVAGMEDKPAFRGPILDEDGDLDPEKIEQEVVEVAETLVRQHPDMGAILLECSNLPPYAHAVQAATGLPVFDFVTLIDSFQSATHRRAFHGAY